MIKGILFDKDGTLIDFYEVWGTAAEPVMDWLLADCPLADRDLLKKELLEKLGIYESGIDPEGAFAWMTYREISEIIWKFMKEKHMEPVPEKTQLLSRVETEFYKEVVEKQTEYPVFMDVKKLFQILTEQYHLFVGLATTDTRQSAKICISRLQAEEYVSFWGADDGIMPVKPDGTLIELAARTWKIHPEEILVVGDTPNDMRFAHNGHAFALGVLSGTGRKKDMERMADDLIDSIAELPAWLERKKGENNGRN